MITQVIFHFIFHCALKQDGEIRSYYTIINNLNTNLCPLVSYTRDAQMLICLFPPK